MADDGDPTRFIIHPDGRIEDTRPPAAAEWRRPTWPDTPRQPKPFELTEGRKKLLWAAVTAAAMIVGVTAGILNRTPDDEAVEPVPTAPQPRLSDAQRQQLQQAIRPHLTAQRVTEFLTDADARLAKLEQLVEAVRAAMARGGGSGLEAKKKADTFESTRQALNLFEKQLEELGKNGVTEDQAATLEQLFTRIDLLRRILTALEHGV
jgi:hypothetical protein